eukprot:scaffold244861_cov30-Tisochrysis_lutea.AAC.5
MQQMRQSTIHECACECCCGQCWLEAAKLNLSIVDVSLKKALSSRGHRVVASRHVCAFFQGLRVSDNQPTCLLRETRWLCAAHAAILARNGSLLIVPCFGFIRPPFIFDHPPALWHDK